MSEVHDSREWHKARAYAKTVLEPICAQCGSELEGRDWTIDHIIPVSKGGDHSIGNLQSMCRSCNGSKQDKDPIRNNWINPKWVN